MLTTHWTVKRARYRASMAREIAKRAKAAGATHVELTTARGSRALCLSIRAPGASCLTTLDGTSHTPATFFLSWATDPFSLQAFSSEFRSGLHRTKATRVCLTFSDLLDTITRDVAACVDGSAYAPA